MSTNERIVVINKDLTTKEGWEAFIGDEKEHALKIHKKGEIAFAEAVLALRIHPTRGTAGSPFWLASYLSIFNNPDDSKDRFATLVRAAALAGNAIGGAFRSEAWIAKAIMNPDGTPSDQQPAPSQRKDRVEAIILATYHEDFGSGGHVAEIKQHPSKPWKRVFGPWSLPGKPLGRFGDLLPTAEERNDPGAVERARALLRDEEERERMIKVLERESTTPH